MNVHISLAAQKGIRDYPCPAGGCLLTDKNFSNRMRDYFTFAKHPSIKDMPLLKVGRHFRLPSGDKVIVAHNESECELLKRLCRESDHLFVPLDFPGPTVMLQGNSVKDAVEKMLQYTKQSIPQTENVIHSYGGESNVISLRLGGYLS